MKDLSDLFDLLANNSIDKSWTEKKGPRVKRQRDRDKMNNTHTHTHTHTGRERERKRERDGGREGGREGGRGERVKR